MTVTVLGKLFESEEERREFFREELRKKLPELKKMDGFPIGEDNDIIKLSDPPYYTVCPNPWLNVFIQDWRQLNKTHNERNDEFRIIEPYASDVSEGKNNAIYGAHSYHTKVPHTAIIKYLSYYTQPGDIIFDGFAGTGMTRVATQLLNHEEGLINGRKCISGDLSPFATYLDYSFNKKIDIEEYIKKTKEINDKLKHEYSWIYQTKHKDGGLGKIKYTIWSEIVSCPNCGHEMNMWSIKESSSGKTGKDVKCEKCDNTVNIKKSNKVYETIYDDILDKPIKQIKLKPVLINYKYKGDRFNKEPDEYDFEILERISSSEFTPQLINNELTNGDKMGDPLNKGYTHVHHFYTRRNFYLINKLFELTDDYNPHKWAVFNTSWHATKMRRYNSGGGHRPMSGTIYFPPNHSEGNMIDVFLKKLKDLKKFIKKSQGYQKENTMCYCDSATSVNINDESIDYIFTDPPFGANLMYSELNLMWESWLKVKENTDKEAIENKSQNKGLFEYQTLLNQCFKNYFRILKSGKWMTVIFSNTNAAVWNSIQNALESSGFIVANVSALDKKQRSINSYVTRSAVKQDLVISCYKPTSKLDLKFQNKNQENVFIWDFIEDYLNHLPVHLEKDRATTSVIERSAKILFDKAVTFYLQKSLPVPMSVSEFQKGLKQRFVEKDGMFFTNEQVHKYDKQKAKYPEFNQLSILVSSENDGILWLKNELNNASKAYQDLTPKWMQALGGERKGDIIPELKTILEENFLQNNDGEWYVPDPENEQDLEKLRSRRLMKQFEQYKEQAFKPKGKVKECRVEALRAGFKQCYQEKDFETIVRVGDRIPNNLLMEDEVLLQFYDIAATKV